MFIHYPTDHVLEAFSVNKKPIGTVSYTHLRAHETRHDLVCRLLLEKKYIPIGFLFTENASRTWSVG